MTNLFIKKANEHLSQHERFLYMLLSRMQSDCHYRINTGITKYLEGGTEISHLSEMLNIYKKLPIAPEWLTLRDFNSLSMEMTGKTLRENGLFLTADCVRRKIKTVLYVIKKGNILNKRG